MAEKSIWAYIRVGMKGRWGHAMRHECMINKGVADASYYHNGNGWIELKEIKKLPARPTTGIKLGRWTDLHQRNFLKKRKGWLFIRVNYPKRMYLIFHHSRLPPDEKPYWTWTQLTANAHYIWTNRIDFETLADILEKPE